MKTALMAVAVVGAVALAAATPVLAKDGDKLVRGTCTNASTSKLGLSDEDG